MPSLRACSWPPAYGLSAEPSGGRGFLDNSVPDSLTSRRISESRTQGSGSGVRAFPGRNGHMEPAVGARARQEFVGLRFTPGSLDKKTDSLLAYACALMAG